MEAFELMVRILMSVQNVPAKLQPTATLKTKKREDLKNK